MTDKRELYDEAILEQKLKAKLGIQHGFVKEVVYHWMENPHVGPNGQQDGAIFKASIHPIRSPLPVSIPDSQEVSVMFEAMGYFHHGSPRHLEERAKRFREGPAKTFLETDPTRLYLDVSDAGAVEPGHYSIDVFIRFVADFPIPQKNPEAVIIEHLSDAQEKILTLLQKF